MEIIPSVDFQNIDTIIGNSIVRLAELPRKKVFNALSARGPQIMKLLGDGVKNSFNLNEAFAVFEIAADGGNANNAVIPGEDINDTIMCYNINIKIYGATGQTIAQKYLSRIRTDENISLLRLEGIYVDGTTYPESVNEFINNTMWPRCDFSVHIQTRYTFDNKNIQDIINQLPAADIDGIKIEKI